MNKQQISNQKSYPSDVIFNYASDSYIPASARGENGLPYTGKACGSNEVAEWYGSFREGLAHGEFQFMLSNGKKGTCEFIKGVKVE